jgi:hypothetical protein
MNEQPAIFGDRHAVVTGSSRAGTESVTGQSIVIAGGEVT